MELKCGNSQSLTDDKLNKNMAHTVVPSIVNAIIQFWKYSFQMPKTYKMLDT